MNILKGYLKKHMVFYITAIALMIVAMGLDMLNPKIQKTIVDDVIIGGNLGIFRGALLSLLGITFSRAVLGYTKEILFNLGSTRITVDIRRKLFDHIQTLSFPFFDSINTGELMSRVKEDVENVWNVLSWGGMLMIEQTLYFVTATVMMFTMNWKMALVSLVTMPVVAFTALKLEKTIGAVYGKISDQRAELNTAAQENLAGVRLVKAFGREKHEIQKFLQKNRESFDLSMEQTDVLAKYHPRIEFLANIIVVLVVTAGGFLAIGEEISLGVLAAFCSYIYMIMWPVRMIGWLTNLLAMCIASLKKIEGIFEQQPTIKNPENPKVPEKFEGAVVFDNVSLDYNGTAVLKNINIEAKPGSTIAIMGMTGAGKSSIINLMGRYYDCTSGSVKLDGIDVRDLDLKALRKQISVVMQDTFLFSDTIGENIKFGIMDASDDELIAAAMDARVHDFVMRMPDGYETVIGERGIGLSGGQKQRISIARALVRNSRILIMDDATSALDMETEYKIQKALEKRKGMTKIVIAHRVSAVKNADEILILENGEIVERGTHQKLLELKGRYYETWCEQYKGIVELDEEEVG